MASVLVWMNVPGPKGPCTVPFLFRDGVMSQAVFDYFTSPAVIRRSPSHHRSAALGIQALSDRCVSEPGASPVSDCWRWREGISSIRVSAVGDAGSKHVLDLAAGFIRFLIENRIVAPPESGAQSSSTRSQPWKSRKARIRSEHLQSHLMAYRGKSAGGKR